MTRVLKSNPIWLVAAIALLAVGLGCSTDSPTAPQQTPAPPPGTEVSASWQITVEVDPGEIAVGATEPVRVSIKVRKVGDNSAPPQGTTIVVSASLGEFQALGSGLTSLALATSNGRAEVLFFPGTIKGTAVISAQLEASAGQTGVRIREGVVAAFETVNGEDNLSIQFINRSTGDPRRFFWDFGDGGISRERDPHHIYPHPGDYVVSLQVERGTFSDEVRNPVFVVEPIFIKDIDPNEGPPNARAVIKGQGFVSPLRVFFSGVNAEVLGVSSTRTSITVVVPTPEYPTEPCELVDAEGVTVLGERDTFFVADITVESLSESVRSDTLSTAFTIFPTDDGVICREAPMADEEGGDGG